MKRIAVLLVLCLTPAAASAQSRPLITEDPEIVAAGQVLIETGFDYLTAQRYPLSGLEGTLLRFPTVGVSIGLGYAELQIDGAAYQRLTIKDRFAAPLAHMLDFTGDQTTSIDDFTIGTKIRFMSESVNRPAIGMRFATKLPMARNERGLGLDTTDFYATLMFAKTVGSLRVVGNAGMGILGDATRGDRQNDVLTYGISFASALTQAAEVVGEFNGRYHTSKLEEPPGTESSAMLRGGLRYTVKRVRVDGGLMFGLTSTDPRFGLTAGLTWVIN